MELKLRYTFTDIQERIAFYAAMHHYGFNETTLAAGCVRALISAKEQNLSTDAPLEVVGVKAGVEMKRRSILDSANGPSSHRLFS